MFVNRKVTGSQSSNRDYSPGPFSDSQLKLTLVDFFDWNVRNWRDFRYYLVKIVAFENKPELVNCEGLVDVLDTDALWNPES